MRRITFDRKRVGDYVRGKLDIRYPGWYEAFGVEDENGNILGGILFNDYNGHNITGHFASENKRWITREMLRLCWCYPFIQLRVKRITGLVAASNTAAIAFDEHLGFKREAVLKNAATDGGDLYVYVKFRDEWQKPKDYHDPLEQVAA